MAGWCVIIWAVVTPDLEDALKADLVEAGMALEQLPADCDLHVHVNIVDARTGTTVLWPPPTGPQHVHTQTDLAALLSDATCWNDEDRRRFLVLWGHGVRAFPSPGRLASVPAAADVVAATSTHPAPDIIGYDACWMATVETVRTLAASMSDAVFIGSMVPEPISGWPYAELVQILCGPGSPKAVAAAVVQAYAASLAVPDWCMVALDLKAVGTVGTGGLTAALGTLMTASPGSTPVPGPVEFFAAADGADILEDTDLVDLGALMRRLQLAGSYPEAAAVEKALRTATVLKRRAGSLAGRDGLAVRVGVPSPHAPLLPNPGWPDYFPPDPAPET